MWRIERKLRLPSSVRHENPLDPGRGHELMDLNLFFRVMWRFKWIVALGLLLAIALATLSYAKISLAHGRPALTYRAQELWQSSATVLITQAGFPWGRAVQGYLPGNPNTSTPSIPNGDPSRMTQLAQLYAAFANSDAVAGAVARQGPPDVALSAQIIPASNNPSQSTPMIAISAVATSPSAAVTTARLGTSALQHYIEKQQSAAAIPAKQRVLVQVVNEASKASVAKPRKKTLPIVVFLAVLIATIGLAFVLENMRPRLRLIEARDDEPADDELAPSRGACA
jgi:capsular polysaccharide biosynthesis protein